ncbi:hypothetical protein PBS_14570 [Paraburkholderia sp. 2C]
MFYGTEDWGAPSAARVAVRFDEHKAGYGPQDDARRSIRPADLSHALRKRARMRFASALACTSRMSIAHARRPGIPAAAAQTVTISATGGARGQAARRRLQAVPENRGKVSRNPIRSRAQTAQPVRSNPFDNDDEFAFT